MKNPRMPLGVAMPLPAIRSTSAPWTTRMIGQATAQSIAAPVTRAQRQPALGQQDLVGRAGDRQRHRQQDAGDQRDREGQPADGEQPSRDHAAEQPDRRARRGQLQPPAPVEDAVGGGEAARLGRVSCLVLLGSPPSAEVRDAELDHRVEEHPEVGEATQHQEHRDDHVRSDLLRQASSGSPPPTSGSRRPSRTST